MQRATPHQSSDRFVRAPTITRRQVIAAGTGWMGAVALPAAAAQSAEPIDTVWKDAVRNRGLPIRLRLPTAHTPVPRGGWPVIVYSHGLGGSRDGGGVWGQAWANAGFVVVHVQHPGSDTDAVRAAPRTGLGRISLTEVAGAGQLLARLQDVVFILDEIARQKTISKQWANVRVDAVGVAGHSFGALTVLGVGGQTYPGYAAIQEPRVGALLALSPTMPVSGEPVQAYAKVTRPTLCITGTLDGDVLGNGATAERRAAVFDALPVGQKAILLVKYADHFTFGGIKDGSGSQRLNQQREAIAIQLQLSHQALVADITVNWWRAYLLGDASAATRLTAPAGLGHSDVWRQG